MLAEAPLLLRLPLEALIICSTLCRVFAMMYPAFLLLAQCSAAFTLPIAMHTYITARGTYVKPRPSPKQYSDYLLYNTDKVGIKPKIKGGVHYLFPQLPAAELPPSQISNIEHQHSHSLSVHPLPSLINSIINLITPLFRSFISILVSLSISMFILAEDSFVTHGLHAGEVKVMLHVMLAL